nr:6-aminohexanoate-dimer hydrolase [Quercus suber]
MATALTNWRDPGHSIWAFQNIDKIIPTALIRKPARPERFEVEQSDLSDFEIVYEYYGRTNCETSKHAVFSITKSITGILCGILAKQGRLDVDAIASSYLPEVKGSSFGDITIRQLLDMRLGLDYDDGEPEYRKASGLVPLKDDERPTNLHEYLPTVQAQASAPVDGLGGPPFKYLSVGADLLGWILERITGNKLGESLADLI